ncbi:MAG: DUF1569 domain-containing protein [Candidatus Sulfotelmatobacter sp.]
MDPHLATLQRAIASAIDGLSAEQLAWHPPQKWCAAEILEHLYLTYTGTIKGFGRVLAAGQPLAAKPTWKNRAQALIVVGFGYLPSGRKAPAHAQPRGLPSPQAASAIAAKIAEMDEVIARCQEKFGPRVKVLDHPFLGPFSTSQWRKFHLVHGLHHVKQIQTLRSQMSS